MSYVGVCKFLQGLRRETFSNHALCARSSVRELTSSYIARNSPVANARPPVIVAGVKVSRFAPEVFLAGGLVDAAAYLIALSIAVSSLHFAP
jgi:hypothetical protein